jgi:solute carrier family 25 protein 34/35
MATLSTLGGFTAGALAACGAVTVTNPMEVVKTRLQLQGELAARGQVKKIYTGVFQALRIIAVNEGIKGNHFFQFAQFQERSGVSGLRFVDVGMLLTLVLLSNIFKWLSTGIL